jgi:long-chain acyl-CoA synthetase
MSAIAFLLSVFAKHAQEDAVVWNDRSFSYGWLLDAVQQAQAYLRASGALPGSVVSLESDFSPTSIAYFLGLVGHGCIVVPLSPAAEAHKSSFRRIAQVELACQLGGADHVTLRPTGVDASHELYLQLRARGHPGLVLFSSGSTGTSKAAVHDLVPLLDKFHTPRHRWRTLAFLLFDHIGGINTLLYTLSNAGCLVIPKDRAPDIVCATIERHRVQLLPTSPTFLNLLLLSEAYKRYDLRSLEVVTYGTEVMPESTLTRFHTLFPHLRLQQTYGLSEVGILRSQSRTANSLWVKIGGEGFETRVVDGILEIRARSAMLGYLNAPSPFTPDGWLRTGDAVEVDGDYIRILGRASELINVGGEKVYPAEVESVLQLMDGVVEVVVHGEPNPITGQMVVAHVRLSTGESSRAFSRRMRLFCRERLPRFKTPQKVVVCDRPLHSERFKKIRHDPVSRANRDAEGAV